MGNKIMTNLKRMTRFWDQHVNDWLNDNDTLAENDHALLERWFDSYSGKGRGAVTREAMPEPWIGDLTSPDHARMVILGLNPGDYKERLQARDGMYAEEVRKLGSYSKWAATNPYLRDPWIAKKDSGPNVYGVNGYHTNRLAFARRWLDDSNLPESSVILLELYPWHSTGVTGPMQPAPDIIRRYVWEPLDELTNVNDIFAFGKPWSSLIERLRNNQIDKGELQLVDILGKGGRDYGSSVASRSVRVYCRPSGKRIIVEWHSGSAGPPSAEETSKLKNALAS
jgi:hypothetical protein